MNRIAKFLMLAVAVVAIGAATATAASLITGKQVKNKSLTGKDVKPKTLAVKHLSVKARSALKGQAGPQGEKGATGPQGERGPSTAYGIRTEAGKTIIDAIDTSVQTKSVPDGSYTLMAKTVLLNTGAVPAKPNCELGVIRGDLFEPLDQVSDITITANNTTSDTLEVVLMGYATLDNGTNIVEVRCVPNAGEAFNARDRTLIATQVAELK